MAIYKNNKVIKKKKIAKWEIFKNKRFHQETNFDEKNHIQ